MSRDTGSRRRAQDIEIPQPKQDAPERKRVLNVLAQRRYRQRKKEHLKKLESQITNVIPSSVSTTATTSEPQARTQKSPAVACTWNPPETYATEEVQQTSAAMAVDCFSDIFTPGDTDLHGDFQDQQSHPSWTFSADSLEHQTFWDPAMALPSLPGTPQLSLGDTTTTEADSLATTPSILDSMTPFQTLACVADQPRSEYSAFSFPDEANLRMLELDLLRASMSVAKRMNIADIIFELMATSPYSDPSMPAMDYDHLPFNLWPTKAQLTIPHHPLFDLLPWPTVRSKMIMVFSQKPETRPPQAASPMAMLDFVYDLEDSAEGVRVWGDDPYSGSNWEVGEKVFSRWWWAFDGEIIKRSNELRKSRGAPMLGQGFIVDET